MIIIWPRGSAKATKSNLYDSMSWNNNMPFNRHFHTKWLSHVCICFPCVRSREANPQFWWCMLYQLSHTGWEAMVSQTQPTEERVSLTVQFIEFIYTSIILFSEWGCHHIQYQWCCQVLSPLSVSLKPRTPKPCPLKAPTPKPLTPRGVGSQFLEGRVSVGFLSSPVLHWSVKVTN